MFVGDLQEMISYTCDSLKIQNATIGRTPFGTMRHADHCPKPIKQLCIMKSGGSQPTICCLFFIDVALIFVTVVVGTQFK